MALIEPGMRVRHPTTDWTWPRPQSVVGERVTVNIEHVGKVLINARLIDLIIEASPAR